MGRDGPQREKWKFLPGLGVKRGRRLSKRKRVSLGNRMFPPQEWNRESTIATGSACQHGKATRDMRGTSRRLKEEQ